MRKTYALLLSGLATLVVVNSIYLLAATKSVERKESIIVARVIDGDTLDTSDGRRLRLANINAPEKGKPGAQAAKAFLQQYENKSLEAILQGTDKSGKRWVAKLYTTNHEYLNGKIIQEGLASKAWVDPTERKQFAAMEAAAIKAGRGIWQPSPYKHCITLSLNAKTENVFLNNSCTNVSFKGWWLKDESREIYTFTNTTVSTLTLQTRKGTNTATTLYWNKAQDIWNDDRDTCYLFDDKNQLVAVYMYGY